MGSAGSTGGRLGVRASAAAVAVLAVALMVAASAGADPRASTSTTSTARGKGGAAATIDRRATRAAIRTLRMGGNAVDAAVAAAGVVGVTDPFSAGIGGGGFMVIRTPGGAVR